MIEDCCLPVKKNPLKNLWYNFDEHKLYKFLRLAYETCKPRKVIFEFIISNVARQSFLLHEKSIFIYPNIFRYIFGRWFYGLEVGTNSEFEEGENYYCITVYLKKISKRFPKSTKVLIFVQK